jgi:hypothetical protein
MPHEVGYYFPQTAVGADGRRVRIHMASYPVIKDGLVYVLDRFNGLSLLSELALRTNEPPALWWWRGGSGFDTPKKRRLTRDPIL